MSSTTFTDGVQASLAPWADADGNWQVFNAALASMFEDVYGIVVAQGSPDDPANYTAGWSTLLDPTACPDQYLPYPASFIGVQIPSGTSPATARAIILAEKNFQAGTPAAVVAAAQLWLSGTQSVFLFERTAADGSTPDAYHFCLAVLTSEVIDAVQLAAAVDAVRPVGVQWTLIETATWTIADLEAAGYSTITALEAAFPDINHLETDVT